MPIKFKTIHWTNKGKGVVAWAEIRNKENELVWSPRSYNDHHWEMTEGQEIWCCPDQDTDGDRKLLTDSVLKAGVEYKIGFNIVWGDDSWYNDETFVFDPNSNITVHFRKHGSVRTGDCAYDGAT